ncbi:MAG TPA: hypothetical protein VNN79_16700, partial [Actinomycetota bacterium]|nr:hypothetical protein [Actinomycetota bacterium]
MIAEADVVRRLHAAAAAVPVAVPDAGRTIHAGRRRSSVRWAGLVTVVVIVAAGTTWAVSQLGG